MCVLRYPGWALGSDEIPPENLADFVAEQLGADATEAGEYAARDQTRREHLQVLCHESIDSGSTDQHTLPICEGISRLKHCRPMRHSPWWNPPWSGCVSAR